MITYLQADEDLLNLILLSRLAHHLRFGTGNIVMSCNLLSLAEFARLSSILQSILTTLSAIRSPSETASYVTNRWMQAVQPVRLD